MKILVKQIDELKGTSKINPKGKLVPEYLVYLMGGSNRPLSAEIVYGKAAKNDLVNDLLLEHFIPNDWDNNKKNFDTSTIVEEVSFDEYLKLATA